MASRRSNKSHRVPNVKLRPAQPSSSSRRVPSPPPRTSSPIYGNEPECSFYDPCPRPFKGVVLCATGVDKSLIFGKASELGATTTLDFTDRVTHLIADAHGGAKYTCALSRQIPIMKPEWILDSFDIWQRGDDVDLDESVAEHRLPIFSDVVLCLSGIEDMERRTEINRIVTAQQGSYVKVIERPVRVTHLLCSGDGENETDKMRYARKFNERGEAKIWLVWEEWFWDSLEFGGRFSEEAYKVDQPRPERKQPPAQKQPINVPDSEPTSAQPDVPASSLPPNAANKKNTANQDPDEEETARAKRVLPAVTLRVWESLLGPRGFVRVDGQLVRNTPSASPSPEKDKGKGKERQRQPEPEPELENTSRRGRSALSTFTRTNSFAPVRPGSAASAVRQPFRRQPSSGLALGLGSQSRASIEPASAKADVRSNDSSTASLFVGLRFRARGEARCKVVRDAVENGGGTWVESGEDDGDGEDEDYVIVRLVRDHKTMPSQAQLSAGKCINVGGKWLSVVAMKCYFRRAADLAAEATAGQLRSRLSGIGEQLEVVNNGLRGDAGRCTHLPMATNPPLVPPRPAEQPQHSLPPPLPPLPPNFSAPRQPDSHFSPPHFEDPLVAPKPHKLNPDLPADMARSLDAQVAGALPTSDPGISSDYYRPPGAAVNITPGFAYPDASRGASPLPPPQGSSWSPWSLPQSSSPPAISSQPPPPPNGFPAAGPQSTYSSYQPISQPPYPPPQQPYSHPQQPYPPAQQPPYPRHQQPPYPPQQQPQQPYPPPQQQPYPPTQQQSYPPLQPRPQSQAYPSSQQSRLPTRPMSSGDALGPAMASLALSTPVRKVTDPTTGPPSLTAPLPTIASLTAALPSIQNPNSNPAPKVAWCRDVFALVDRMQASSSPASATGATDTPPPGPVEIADPQLQRLAQVAAPLIIQLSNPDPVPNPLPPHVAEAIFMRASFAATGAYPQVVPHNPRTAFRDYERSARAGIHAAWFRLGRDYENFGDFSHAKECFERGVKANNESCLYRMGMAHLMGQLNQSANAEAALPLLHRAATLATVEVPQPAYVFGLLLLSEFSHVNVPPHLFAPFLPPGGTREGEARRHLERAAYLNFAPAQYKLGHAYEFAQPPFPFDALLSVQYYSLASQQGEIEADMALSKWFLCGADGAFEKDEALAFTFAEKAAKKSLPSAEFAMGYYMEVGVGGPKDIEAARKWYTRAAGHGNTDAQERLAALSQPAPQSLSRQEHDSLTETTLVRKRTQAKQRSDARGPATQPAPGGGGQQQVMAHVRKASLAYRPAPGQNSYASAGPVGQNYPLLALSQRRP
ncbi:hypothetical protein EVG20_g8092, partial [Dentipellis fragilis]